MNRSRGGGGGERGAGVIPPIHQRWDTARGSLLARSVPMIEAVIACASHYFMKNKTSGIPAPSPLPLQTAPALAGRACPLPTTPHLWATDDHGDVAAEKAAVDLGNNTSSSSSRCRMQRLPHGAPGHPRDGMSAVHCSQLAVNAQSTAEVTIIKAHGG